MRTKNLQVILVVCSLFLLSVAGCKKDSSDPYECTTCSATPEASASNDASSKGVYKGVVTGSSGTISFDVMNAGTTITAKMVLDGVTVNLTSGVTWVSGQAYVAAFTGLLNNAAVSITFSVGANGGSPMVTTASIPGHTSVQFTLVKETSTSLIEVFEGTYHTTLPEDGSFNMVLSRSAKVWGADARASGETVSDQVSGTITVDNKLIESGITIGTLSADEINGSFTDGNGKTVTIKGKRTL